MKKTLKRLGAAFLAGALVAAMAVPAMAAVEIDTDGVNGEIVSDVATALDKQINLKKELTVYNPNEEEINAPTITYTYKIEAGSKNKTIVDTNAKAVHTNEKSVTVLTKEGIIPNVKIIGSLNGTAKSGVIAGDAATDVSDTIEWTTAGKVNAKPNGNANYQNLGIDFTNVAFPGAGVYRYKITETAATYEQSGVVDGEITNVRYLDVYVKDGATAGTYDIYGYVCFTNDNDIKFNVSGSVEAAGKTAGFVDTDSNTGDDVSTADRYYTYDVTIKKTLNGDAAKNSNQFPFKVTFANTKVTDNVLPVVASTGTVTAPTLTAKAIKDYVLDGTSATATDQIKIANGGSVTFKGIPAGTTVTIDEYNNVDYTIYSTHTTGGSTNTEEAAAINLNPSTWASATTGWTNVTTLTKVANENSKAEKNFEVEFINTLRLISPTGVALRFAPYIMMLVAGLAILLVGHKRREED